MGSRHEPALLAEFQDGERCLVWARALSDGSLYHLEDGTAHDRRAWAKEHLECFMPECTDRRLTTVARHPRRRDGFRHYTGAGGHSYESEAHQQGKAALVTRITQTLGPAGVTAHAERSTSDRKRVADVLVRWPTGEQVAIEVQYAPLSVEKWQERHDSYRAQGIVDVWLLGHASKHLRAARPLVERGPDEPVADDVALGDLHHAIAAAGVPLLWINPVLATIGTVSQRRSPHRSFREYGDGHDDTTFDVPPDGTDPARAPFHVDELDNCTLTPAGLTSPTLTRLRTAAATLEGIDRARRATDAAEAAARAAEQQHRDARERADAERREKWVAAQKVRQQAAWDASPLRSRVLARYNQVPELLTVKLGTEHGIYAPAEHWRAAIYANLIWNRTGTSFTMQRAYAVIYNQQIPLDRCRPAARGAAIRSWLEYLEHAGYVDVVRSIMERNRVDQINVRGDLDRPPPPRPPKPPPPPPPPPKPVTRPPATVTTTRDTTVERMRAAARRQIEREYEASLVGCRSCSLPLDQSLAKLGHHIGC